MTPLAAIFEDPLNALAGVVILAVAAAYIASRLNIPSIVALLATGVIVGPGLLLIDPDAMAGDLLTPFVSLAVGLILFEGGLSLRLHEARRNPLVLWLLVTVGVLITWLIGSVSASLFLGVPRSIAVLLGAILIVSGPTVIGPILHHVRPTRTVTSILKWESIVIDPIGAMLAALTFEIILLGAEQAPGQLVTGALLFIGAGLGAGLVVALPTGFVIQRHLVPERLVPLVGMSAALLAFAVAHAFAPESGLLATPVLGFVLANNSKVRTEPLIDFSEKLQLLLVGILFILLSARLSRDQLGSISWGVGGVIAVLVLVARPISVAVATWRSGLTKAERIFLASVAPRGIVAAAVASVFALELEHAGVAGAELLTPVTFAVIVGTVIVYGFGAGPIAHRFGLAEKSSQGVLILGAGPVEEAIGRSLFELEIPVLFSSTNHGDEARLRQQGFRTYYGNLIGHELPWDLEMSGLGRLLALTPNDEVNTLAARSFAQLFGAAETYQLTAARPGPGLESVAADIGGRSLFDSALTYGELRDRLRRGVKIRQTSLTEKFTVADLKAQLGTDGRMLFVARGKNLLIATDEQRPPLIDKTRLGDTVLWIPSEAAPAAEPPSGGED
ncbi:MAG: sodium:proton antiporter [Acidimicrobiia bacterium]|nr:sodium:proton antiporter [Acidimicrobiia bacterium]